jgi:hypothetical protein
VILPKRRIVERTFAWLSRSRRLSQDHERLLETTETLIDVRMIQWMSRRLARRQSSMGKQFLKPQSEDAMAMTHNP